MLKKLLNQLRPGPKLKSDLSYEEARNVLESQSRKVRAELAQHKDAKPEMLYYLAEDDSSDIRALVAANPSTPIQADKILASDTDDEVRAELAHKIGRLVPGLTEGEADQLREQAIEILEVLASDHLPRIRQIVSEEIKKSNKVPHSLVKQLAEDVEAIVAAPILEYSPLLGDDDLLEIIAGGIASGALEAIAKRDELSSTVSDAVVATLDIPAVSALLVNPNAQIREETLDEIINHADKIDSWHEPLVMRPDLSIRAIKRIAGFVASSLIETLSKRNELDEKTRSELSSRVRDRLQKDPMDQDGEEAAKIAQKKVAQAQKAGALNDEYVSSAIEAGDKPLVIAALSALSGNAPTMVERIVNSKQGKAIVALNWSAKLPMRISLGLQRDICRVPPNAMVMAKNGFDYPQEPEEMKWHLEYFTKTA